MLGELTPLQIERVLRSENVGRIGLHAAGKTYVVPVTYVYEENQVIGHTGDGLKVKMARENPNVCFEVEHIDNLANWQSVICQGRFVELAGEEAGQVMRRFVEHLMPLMTSATMVPGTSNEPTHGLHPQQVSAAHQRDVAGRKSVIWRIELTEKSGRFEKR